MPQNPSTITYSGTPPVFVVLDGRDSPAWMNASADIFRLWVGAAQEAVPLHPEAFSSLSVVALHEGYYESCLPLAVHSPTTLVRMLGALEEKWVLGRAGLGGSLWGPNDLFGGGRGGMLPEHAAEVQDGFAPVKKRGKKTHASSPPRGGGSRLFAVGEDTALAALRSALMQLAKLKTKKRLEYWTSEPDLLFPVISELSHYVSEGVEFVILLVATNTAKDNMQQYSKAHLLETKFLSQRIPKGATVRVETLNPTAASFARQVRAPLDVSLPIRLRLPGHRQSSPDDGCYHGNAENPLLSDMTLLATPTVLLSAKQRQSVAELLASAAAMPSSTGVAVDFDIICWVSSCNISCELLFGVPLVAQCAPDAQRSVAATFQAVARKMETHEHALVLSANVCPLRLAPTTSTFFFVAFFVPPEGRLLLRGVASADNWHPDTLHERGGSAPSSTKGSKLATHFKIHVQELPSFNPAKLRCNRAIGIDQRFGC